MQSIKIFKVSAAILFAALFSSSFLSCTKDPEPVAAKNIAEIVIEGADFTLLKAALTKAELVETFKGAGPFTVFAPTDAAFKAAGLDQAGITATSKETLAAVLKYHALGKKVGAADILTADNSLVETLGGGIFVTKNAGGVSVNGAKVTTADVSASNGVVHVIDRVLFPNTKDLVATLSADASYSLLVAAVVQADLVSTLQGAGPFTVFAPNDAAFVALGAPYNTVANIKTLTSTQQKLDLKNVLLFHVVGARVFSPNLKPGAVATAGGKSVTVNLDGGVKIQGTAAANVANVVTSPVGKFNFNASNGVIHTIDKVLIP